VQGVILRILAVSCEEFRKPETFIPTD